MARPKNTTSAANNKTDVSEHTDKTVDTAVDNKDSKNASKNVDELMRLYPQYDEIWVTSNGFVHPKGVPAYLTKDAVLYKNKYYKP